MRKPLKLKDLPPREFERLINRGTFEVEKILPRVIPLIEKVRKEKDKAVIELTEKFDGVKLSSLVVSEKEKKEAFKKVSSHFVCAIEKMCRQVEDFHRHQFPSPFSFEKSSEMSSGEKSSEERYLLGEKFSPVKRAAIYVPGGKASYPSTAVMGCVPARLAGVEEIIVCSPPSAEGKMQAEVIVASSLAGATTLIKAGGVQAIAACAWGTESVPEVDFIAGPGNIFVSCAKIYLASLGKIGIDCFAGPSEVLIIADANAPFSFVAWDMLAQAEHDEDAWCILLTDSENLAFRVWEEIEKNVNFLERKKIALASLEKNGFILIVDKIEEAAGFANRFAPEHLEIITENPDKIMSLIENAGCIFLGPFSPVAAGDYITGTNHILPTSGTARFFSGLGVTSFMKRIPYQRLSYSSLFSLKSSLLPLAEKEGFQAHLMSVKERFKHRG